MSRFKRQEYRERLLQRLREELQPGEALRCYVFGAMRNEHGAVDGVFGLTEEHLIMVLSALETRTVKMPLRFETLRFLKNAVEVVVDEEWEFRLQLPCRVPGIGSQKEQRLAFLDGLCTGLDAPVSQSTRQRKIRFQYFNSVIYLFLPFAVTLPVVMPVFHLLNGSFQGAQTLLDSLKMLIAIGFLLSPLALLSVLNRYLFGTVKAVATEHGLMVEHRLILWKDIVSVDYHAKDALHRKREVWDYNHATLVYVGEKGWNETLQLWHFPYYGARLIRKHAPHAAVALTRESRRNILLDALLPAVLFLLVAVIKAVA